MRESELDLAASLVSMILLEAGPPLEDLQQITTRWGVTDSAASNGLINSMSYAFARKHCEWSCLRLYHSILLPLSGSRLMAATATHPDPLDACLADVSGADTDRVVEFTKTTDARNAQTISEVLDRYQEYRTFASYKTQLQDKMRLLRMASRTPLFVKLGLTFQRLRDAENNVCSRDRESLTNISLSLRAEYNWLWTGYGVSTDRFLSSLVPRPRLILSLTALPLFSIRTALAAVPVWPHSPI